MKLSLGEPNPPPRRVDDVAHTPSALPTDQEVAVARSRILDGASKKRQPSQKLLELWGKL